MPARSASRKLIDRSAAHRRQRLLTACELYQVKRCTARCTGVEPGFHEWAKHGALLFSAVT